MSESYSRSEWRRFDNFIRHQLQLQSAKIATILRDERTVIATHVQAQ
jgi:hypothetical protein